MTCERHFFSSNGLSIRESQGGTEHTIVMLHGSGFCKEIFDPQFYSSAFQNSRLITIDLPGHGASVNAEDPVATYCFSGLALEVERALMELELDDCVVVGWSLGGHVGIELSKRYPKVRGVLATGAPPVSGGPLGLLRSAHFSKALLLASKAQFSLADAQLFERNCLSEKSDGRFSNALIRTDPLMRPTLAKSTLHQFGPGQLGDLKSSYLDICLIHGELDPFNRTRYMRSLNAACLYRGGTIMFENSGHAPFFTEPDRFNSLLLEFCDYVQIRASRDNQAPMAA